MKRRSVIRRSEETSGIRQAEMHTPHAGRTLKMLPPARPHFRHSDESSLPVISAAWHRGIALRSKCEQCSRLARLAGPRHSPRFSAFSTLPPISLMWADLPWDRGTLGLWDDVGRVAAAFGVPRTPFISSRHQTRSNVAGA